MSFVEIFSRESSEASALACDNDAFFLPAVSYGLPLDDTTPATLVAFPGIYRVWLQGRDPAVSVYLAVGSSEPVAEPDDSGKPCIAFAGDMTVRLRIPPAGRDENGAYGQTLSALLNSGASSAKLFLVLTLPWLDEQGG